MSKLLVVEADSKVIEVFSHLRTIVDDLTFEIKPIQEIELRRYSDYDLLSPMIYSRVNREVIDSFQNLRLIATRSTGFDHIDIKAASERGIIVCNSPGYGSIAVAEHTFALLLAVMRKILKADASVRAATWPSTELRGESIQGKVFGIIGTGAIGISVAKIAKAFGAQVIAYDKVIRKELEEEGLLRYVSLEDLLRTSDIISIHVPLTEETRHLIDEVTISMIKRGAVLINTSRGAIIDQRALVRALKEGKLAGAGLDVLEEEPPGADDPILKLENVVLSPHIAWNTDLSKEMILNLTIDNIRSFLEGRPKNVVNAELLRKLTIAC